MKIIVGVDGSVQSMRAVEWCASVAKPLDADVVAVFALDFPLVAESGFGFVPIPVPMPWPTESEREHARDVVERDWCAPLETAGVPFRAVVVTDGSPAAAIMTLAEKESADLVVTGRRGRGGFAELVLGSTSHHLSHHLDRPLVIVP